MSIIVGDLGASNIRLACLKNGRLSEIRAVWIPGRFDRSFWQTRSIRFSASR